MRILSPGNNLGIAFCAITLAALVSNQAYAQAGQSVNGHAVASKTPLPATPRAIAPKKPPVDTFGKPIILSADKIQMDDIPTFTGKHKFQQGAVFGAERSGADGALTVVTYEMGEPRKEVKDWYANALRMYGWDITYQSPNSITAMNSKSGNSATFQFCDQDSAHRGQSLMQIDYHRTKR